LRYAKNIIGGKFMAMRETSKSLRIYFFIVSAILWLKTFAVFSSGFSVVLLAWLIPIVFIAASYLVIGFKIDYFLKEKTNFIYLCLGISLLTNIVNFVTANIMLNQPLGFVPLLIGIAIVWYLYVNVKLLSNSGKESSDATLSTENN
jgi:hypothetical protein